MLRPWGRQKPRLVVAEGGQLVELPKPDLSPGRYVACPVKLDEIVTHPDGMYPAKVKAPRVCGPVWEVDATGNRVKTREEAA